MAIKSARMNGVVVTDEMLLGAISELATAHNITVQEQHAIVLSRVADRNSAECWAEAIGLVATEQEASSNVRVRPARTTTEDDTVGLSAEDAAQEVIRLVQEDSGRRKPVLADKPSARVPCRTVQLSREARSRMYDDELALTSTTSTQAEVDAYVLKLARSGVQGRRAFGADLALAVPDIDDVTEPTVSDLSDEVSLPDQSTEFGKNTLSQQAEQQLAALAPAYQTALQAFLDGAASEDDPSEAESLLESAADLAGRFGLTVLRNEISARAEALRLGTASYLNRPEEAEAQTAGGVAAEVTRYSELANVRNGNLSTPPKSAAVRAAESLRARPGHT